MAETTVLRESPPPVDTDHYLVEREGERVRVPVGTRIVRVLRAILVIIMAAVSLALFWVVGTMLGVF